MAVKTGKTLSSVAATENAVSSRSESALGRCLGTVGSIHAGGELAKIFVDVQEVSAGVDCNDEHW